MLYCLKPPGTPGFPCVGPRDRGRCRVFAVHRWTGRAAECQWRILRRPEARRSDSQESIAATRRAIGANALGDTRLAARVAAPQQVEGRRVSPRALDRKSTRLNSSHGYI